MAELKTVKEVAEIYGVTTMAVRHWLAKGLKCQTEKIIGLKPRKVIKIKDVENFLQLTKR